MVEIQYTIDEITTAMFVADSHTFYLSNKQWVTAKHLTNGDKIQANSGEFAKVLSVNLSANSQNSQHFGNLKTSHNHRYFITKTNTNEHANNQSKENITPHDPLEWLAFDQADKPSKLANGAPSGHHSGPWVAAKYHDITHEVIALGCANDLMCAEDAAIKNLKNKLAESSDLSAVTLHRGNVTLSHAYVRKYSRKGRIVNIISPCQHCRANYGKALSDPSLGKSNIEKRARDYLPPNEPSKLSKETTTQ